MTDAAIVGAGPAGIAAASVLLAHGVRPVLFDEADRPGGQIYRQPAEGLKIDMPRLLGADYQGYRAFHTRADRVCAQADYRNRHTVWAIDDGSLWAASNDNAAFSLPYKALILATGAIDRIFPVKGWTQPGVYALGGTQALLKQQGCLIGNAVVFCGSSPLLYLAALQYRRMGGDVAAVLDTTPFRAKLASAPRLLSSPGTFLRGLGYMRRLRAEGVPIHHGADLLEFTGNSDVTGVRFADRAGAERTLSCDAVAFGYGLKPESQLADLAGCAFRYDPAFSQWLPRTDPLGRAAPNVYLAGDGAEIGGAEAATLSGTLAGYAALSDMGIAPKGNTVALLRKLRRLRTFQKGLAGAFRVPTLAGLADDVTLCRCEAISAETVRQAVAAPMGPREINRLKARTRCGMGRCQARYCELAVRLVAAEALGVGAETLGRLRGQAPVKPLPASAFRIGGD